MPGQEEFYNYCFKNPTCTKFANNFEDKRRPPSRLSIVKAEC